MTKAIEKAKQAKKIKNKLMLTNGVFNSKQLLTILQKTPKEHIYTRPAKGGGQWEYVTGIYTKKVLNYVFGWMWDFQVVDKGREGDLIWVQGRLTIRDRKGAPMIIKEQFGRADIKFQKGKPRKSEYMIDYGNDLKSATTDALKKCASELGIASDIYGKNEFREVGITIEEKPKDNLMAGDEDKSKIKKLAGEIGLTTTKQIEKKIGITIDLENLTKVQARRISAELLNLQVK